MGFWLGTPRHLDRPHKGKHTPAYTRKLSLYPRRRSQRLVQDRADHDSDNRVAVCGIEEGSCRFFCLFWPSPFGTTLAFQGAVTTGGHDGQATFFSGSHTSISAGEAPVTYSEVWKLRMLRLLPCPASVRSTTLTALLLVALGADCGASIDTNNYPSLACPLLQSSMFAGMDSVSILLKNYAAAPTALEEVGTPCATATDPTACLASYADALKNATVFLLGYPGCGGGDIGPQCFLGITMGDRVLVPTSLADVLPLLLPIDNSRKAVLLVAISNQGWRLDGCGNVRIASDGYEVVAKAGYCMTETVVVVSVHADGTMVKKAEALVTEQANTVCSIDHQQWLACRESGDPGAAKPSRLEPEVATQPKSRQGTTRASQGTVL